MSRLMEKLATRAWKKNIDVIDRHPEHLGRTKEDSNKDGPIWGHLYLSKPLWIFLVKGSHF